MKKKPEALAQEYKRLKLKIEAIELALEPLRQELSKIALKSPNQTFVAGPFKVTLTEAEREVIKLREAKEKLGAKLAPFLRITEYQILRVS